MKFSIVSLGALLSLTTAYAAEFKACSGTNLNGSCTAKTSLGKQSGSYKSYNWRASSNVCMRVCKGCTSLGYRCSDYSNNDISFDKFIIFGWAGGEGPGSASCC